MFKLNSTSVISTLVAGMLVTQAVPAQAQQVQVNGAAPVQTADPSAAPAAPQPAAQVQVNTPAPVVAAPAPIVVNNVQTAEGSMAMRRPYGRLMISGATMFGVIYVSTVLGAAIASDVCNADSALGCRQASWPIYVPILGPFIQMGYLNGSGVATGRAVLAIDGVLQATGVAMFIAGAALWRSASPTYARVAKHMQLAPYPVSSGGGLLAVGRF